MDIKTYILKSGQAPTAEQIEEVRRAAARPVIPDDDCPEFTDEQLKQFHRVVQERMDKSKKNRKQSITLRLSPKAAQKARSLGKGYTSILAGILESALEDPTYIKNLHVSGKS